ncbi:MAG TPA: hypothetical protein QF555_03705, partial [Candidatus Thalassarchaeaceae archaeon]|nr:hypothetical protein [Candidatus Thalassarchaeaceae archaeon]
MTLSPDGQWMWDGQAWIPAPPAHTPGQIPQITTMPHLQQPVIQPAGMYIQQKPQGSGGIIVLVIVIVLIIPVAAIIGSGVLYVWA